MSKIKYECKNCGKVIEVEENEKLPECCGDVMNVCTKVIVAEHYRPFDEDDACDDGTAGVRR